MFWGRGDTSKLTEGERKTLNDLQRMVETGHIVGLTPEQSELALDAIKFYGSVRAGAGLVVGFRNVLVFVGGLLMIWWASNDAIIQFIRTVVAAPGATH